MIFLVTRMILKMTFSSLSLNLPFYDKSNGDGYDDDDDNYNYTEYHNDDNDYDDDDNSPLLFFDCLSWSICEGWPLFGFEHPDNSETMI